MADKESFKQPTCNEKAPSREPIPLRKQMAMGKNPQTGCRGGKPAK